MGLRVAARESSQERLQNKQHEGQNHERRIVAAISIAFFASCAVCAAPASAHGHAKHLVRIYKATLLLNTENQSPFSGADLNNRGEVAGRVNVPDALWRDGAVEALGSLPGMPDAEAKGINDFDHVVGVSFDSRTGIERAFLWRQGRMKPLPLMHEARNESSSALAINTWDQILGSEQITGGALSRATLWERGHAFDLNALASAGDLPKPHVTLRSAFRINEWGQILALAENDQEANTQFYYLLTPTFVWR